jgi:hypothetical protein
VSVAWVFLVQTLLAQQSIPVRVFVTSPGLENPAEVPCHGVFEITFLHPNDYGRDRNFFDIDIQVTFVDPGHGRKTTIGGFFYETLARGGSLWKCRFVPTRVGTWTYSYTFTHLPSGKTATGAGSFEAVPSTQHGFIRTNPKNPFRWISADGQPFVPIGFNDCVGANDLMNFDGGDKRGAFLGPMRTDEYLQAYEDAGFNVFRFSQANCSPKLLDASLRNYDKDVAMYFDWLMERLRAHHFRIYYGLLGNLLPDDPPSPAPADLFQFIDYSINRWSSYVDIWEIQNERRASAEWISAVAGYLRMRDPYRHPITTSHERPELSEIEINTPHNWVSASASQADEVIRGNADERKKKFGKPVIFGEVGNGSSPGQEAGNWLPESALRLRIMAWTALFREISLLFWNTSYATNGSSVNIYLGLEERQYVHVLQWFAGLVIRSDSKIMDIENAESSPMRAYGLTSSDGIALYIHHFEDHSRPLSGRTLAVDIPADGQGFWLDPATGKKIGSVKVTRGRNTLAIPDFEVDVAFLSTATMPFHCPPVAVLEIGTPEADRDLDDDGVIDFGPIHRPFGAAPLNLVFNAKNSSDLDGGTLDYRWHFGDGSPDQSQPEVTHTYAAGDFLAGLTVTDDEGNHASQSFVVRAREISGFGKNHAPLLNAMDDVQARPGELIMLTPWAVDRELKVSGYAEDELEYSIKRLPPGASFGRRGADWGRQFWWVPDFSQTGSYLLEFGVRDQYGLKGAARQVKVTVR